MIVGTAGHIDHGKTTLVRALTGVDTDRLPEERKRGISIELGYAFVDVPGGDERIGFIDVPGHERLVHTMLAGATGILFALLLVAADDGVMPQTREHLAVLSLLGLSRGAVVVTKCDRVDAARADEVAAQAAVLLKGTTLAGAPVLQVSAQTGEGIAVLKQRLFDAARETATGEHDSAAFRLAIDRAFSLDGIGTVVTGTLHAGSVAIGDELLIIPGQRPARVRSLHAQNRAVSRAYAGQRCAVAVAGIDRNDIERGQWLVAPAAVSVTDRLDARITLWQGEQRGLRSGTSVHVHLGSATTLARVAMLEPALLEPAQEGLVQLVLHRPIGAWHGDRVVLRDAAASRTLAGGTVLDPNPPMRYRRTAQRLSELSALALPQVDARLQALLAVAPQGVDLQRFAIAQGRTLGALADDVLRHTDARSDHALGTTQATHAAELVLSALAEFHAQHAEELGPDASRLRRLALPRLPEPLWRALLVRLQAQGRVVLRGAFVHLPEHGVRLSAIDERLIQKIMPLLVTTGFEGTWVRDLARDSGESELLLRVTLARVAQRGELFQVVKDLYYPPATMARLTAIAREIACRERGEIIAATFRDATGLGRKRAIQILEHFDRIGLLRRVGDLHRLRAESTLFAEAVQA
ncbi:MAG: selenocysteine-specific translation elongation factor [Ideonella sp.]